jgi:hypothetical protein
VQLVEQPVETVQETVSEGRPSQGRPLFCAGFMARVRVIDPKKRLVTREAKRGSLDPSASAASGGARVEGRPGVPRAVDGGGAGGHRARLDVDRGAEALSAAIRSVNNN